MRTLNNTEWGAGAINREHGSIKIDYYYEIVVIDSNGS